MRWQKMKAVEEQIVAGDGIRSVQNSQPLISSTRQAWRKILNDVSGAALRLHRHRDARDRLLRRLLCEQERRLSERRRCRQ